MLIFLCDGSSKGNPGPSSIGIIGWKRTPQNPRKIKPDITHREEIRISTNNEAEWAAIIRALEIAEERKEREVYIYSDSQLIVNQALGNYKCKDNNLRQYLEIYKDFEKKIKIHIGWLPRQLTYLADKEAQ